jgi:hypothetical protein
VHAIGVEPSDTWPCFVGYRADSTITSPTSLKFAVAHHFRKASYQMSTALSAPIARLVKKPKRKSSSAFADLPSLTQSLDFLDLAGVCRQMPRAILVRCLINGGTIRRLSSVPGIVWRHRPPDFTRPTQVPEVIQGIRDMSSAFGIRFAVGAKEVV